MAARAAAAKVLVAATAEYLPLFRRADVPYLPLFQRNEFNGLLCSHTHARDHCAEWLGSCSHKEMLVAARVHHAAHHDVCTTLRKLQRTRTNMSGPCHLTAQHASTWNMSVRGVQDGVLEDHDVLKTTNTRPAAAAHV